MQKSKASHPAVHEHQRPPICAEEAVGFHKRPKMIHEPVKIVVPCAIFVVEFPIPPDKGAHLSSYIEVLNDHQHLESSQRGLRFRDEVYKGPAEAASIDTDRIPSNDTNKPASIKTITSTSIDTHRVSEQKEYEVCQNLFDGGTTTRPDKSGGKKRRNWKKRKGIKDGPQLSLIPHFSYRVKKSKEEDELCTIMDRKPTGVARQSITSIDHHLTVLIDTHINGSLGESSTDIVF
ncbi:hypothetical protein F2Q70_00004333 [Brassica cretica]|uniref:Uncharacterized protein n=1 Tax=Brassica cretica TaxID=69181 RepID=A0A8S9J0H2_BRACR|nr:hypothetical protein F2Q70_00004333 [Brassica cretica]